MTVPLPTALPDAPPAPEWGTSAWYDDFLARLGFVVLDLRLLSRDEPRLTEGQLARGAELCAELRRLTREVSA